MGIKDKKLAEKKKNFFSDFGISKQIQMLFQALITTFNNPLF